VGTLAVDAVADLLLPHWDVDPARLHPVLLHEEGADGAAIAAAQLRRCGERGFTGAESVAYSAGTLDFAPIVQRLRGVGADVLLHSAEVADVVPLHRAMQQAGWRPRMVVGAGGGYELADTAAALGAGFDGVMCAGVTPYRIADAAAPGVPAVAAAYQRKYGAPPRSGHSLVCFAGARVVLDALSRAASLDAEAVRTALLAIDIPSGVTSAGWGVKFDDKGQNTRAVPYLAQWQGGALLTVAPLDAAVAAVIQRLGG